MKKIICILLCISLILLPVLMTGCDENDKKDEITTIAPSTDSPTEAPTDEPTDQPTDMPSDKPADEPTDAPTDAPTDEPTDAPTDTPTDSDIPTTDTPDDPKQEPITDDPKSYVKFNAGLADLLIHISQITGDYREKILTGNEKFDSGRFNVSANALSFAGNDYLSGNKYSLDVVFAHDKVSGTVASATFKGTEETGLKLFVTADGCVYVMIPSVDNTVYVKLTELGDLIEGSESSDGTTGSDGNITLPGISGDGIADKLPETVKNITEEKVSVTVLGQKLNGVVKLTLTVDAKTLESLVESLPGTLKELVSNYFPDGIPENAETKITLWVYDGTTVLADISVNTVDKSFDLSIAVVGDTGKEDYELTLATEDKEGKTNVKITGKRENSETVTKGSLALRVTSTKTDSGTADTGSSGMISSLLGSGDTSVGFSYERKVSGNKTETLYKISLGIDAGFTTVTLNIPFNTETVRGADGSVSHTFSIDTVKANLPKELINIQLSAGFTLGEGLDSSGVTMPVFTAENTLDPNDPDDADALAAYKEKFQAECKELADLIENLFGSSDPEEPEERILEGSFKSVDSKLEQTYEFTADGKFVLSTKIFVTVKSEGTYKIVGDKITLTTKVSDKEQTSTYDFSETDTGIVIDGKEYARVS